MSDIQSIMIPREEEPTGYEPLIIDLETSKELTQFLRYALRANAIFSSFSGLIMILFASQIGPLFGPDPVQVNITRILGIVLLIFAAQLYLGSKSTSYLTKTGYYGAINDIVWIIGTTIILLISTQITTSGKVLLIAVGIVVVGFSVLQFHGITRIPMQLKGSMIMGFPISPTWEVIADVDRYHEYADGIKHVEMINLPAEGQGMVRRCYDARDLGWNEECTEYKVTDTYRSYTMNVDTSDYPYPFSIFRGTWTAESIGPSKTIVSLQFIFRPKMWLLGRLLITPKVASMSKSSLIQIFHSYQDEIARIISIKE